MAFFADIEVTDTAWVDLHAATSNPAGTSLTLQNTGQVSLRTINAATVPAVSKTIGILANPSDDQWGSSPAAGEVTWAIAVGGATGVIGVQT